MDICANCTHHINDPKAFNSELWYNHFCGAITREKAKSSTTGQELYIIEGINVFGQKYRHLNKNPHPYCRDINKEGKCDKFKENLSNVNWNYLLKYL